MRAFLVVMDSVGIGGAPDADRFFNGDVPDTGANTVLNIAQACQDGLAEQGRRGPLNLPTLTRLGLGNAIQAASGKIATNLPTVSGATWAAATEQSQGKDTPSGHWELAGLTVPWDWHYFPNTQPSFPKEVIDAVCRAAHVSGILGDCHASGTEIIQDLGQSHVETGQPICYTSIDSVFQIAAHETHFGLQRLYDLCTVIAPMLHEMKVGRVIARPFVGDHETGWTRTSNRRDFAIEPPRLILTNYLQNAGVHTRAIGKIGDILSMQGIDQCVKGDDETLMTALGDHVDNAPDHSFTFANFVEFDSLYGHRRDVSGYACALEWFDQKIGNVIARLRPDDVMILTADHGNDPTWIGTDHTRERVPVLIAGAKPKDIGVIGFHDVAATIAQFFDVPYHGEGKNIL